MFTTFVGTEQPPPPSKVTPNRAKRKQVAKACEWCRIHRIKCDSNFPCHNCQSRGGQCSNRGSNELRTLPRAVKEIEQLRLRVKELEEQLETRDNEQSINNSEPTNRSQNSQVSLLTLSPATNSASLRHHGGNEKYWDAIHMRTAKSSQTQCYGPSSMYYFIGRMISYLDNALQQSHLDDHMLPNSASRCFTSPTTLKQGHPENSLMPADVPMTANYLTRTQEEYFLGLFWQSCHCVYQILDERDFREHYKSLWTAETCRKQSSLVDIVLAICMQYGVGFIPRSDGNGEPSADVDASDATIAGRWFYRRSQTLLAEELESPSISTLQCHIFSVIYLCNASFQNMAHSSLALAIRTAQILGLQFEPPADMPRPQRELRKRLWWTLYALEIKTCMKLGRPWSAAMSHISCSLPADDAELASLSSSNFGSWEGSTWLSYTLQNLKLVLAVHTIYKEFYDKCAEVLGYDEWKTLYTSPNFLESCAKFLSENMHRLRTWLQEVPDALKTSRKGSGQPFSTDRSALEIDLLAPLWLQRQRLVLELLYHNLALNLYRPFICFSTATNSCTPLAEGHAISCVNHAMALTHIMHQVLTQTDILSGWHEPYLWQWNATISLIGFILAYPIAPSTPPARKAISNAIAVFEKLGNNFAMAASAAKVTRDLAAKADFLIDRFRIGLVPPDPSQNSNLDPSRGGGRESYYTLQPRDDTSALLEDTGEGSLDFAFAMDSFNAFEPLSPNGTNMFENWMFT